MPARKKLATPATAQELPPAARRILAAFTELTSLRRTELANKASRPVKGKPRLTRKPPAPGTPMQ